MSRQGFYRLPLSTIDAVTDGVLTIFDWSLFVWIAANADFKTGLYRTSAPSLSSEMGVSAVSIRKSLRKLRERDFIFYSTAKRGLYPIGVYGYMLPDSGRTATAAEWRLNYGKSFRLISEGLPQINLWINLWINLNNEFSGGQMSLRESAGQSGGQSVRATQTRVTTRKTPPPAGPTGQSGGQSADQSGIAAGLENTNVDLRSADPDQRHTRESLDCDSTGELAGDVSSSTNNLNGKIWTLYERKYRERTRSGINPGHSRREASKSIDGIRYVLDPMRKTSTDEQYLRLLSDAFDVYFHQQDIFVSGPTVMWNLATFVARLPGILEEMERRVV